MSDRLNPAPEIIDYEGVTTYIGGFAGELSCEQIGNLIKYRDALDSFWTSIRDYHKTDRRMIREKIFKESTRITKFINAYNEFVRTNGTVVAILECETDYIYSEQ